MKQFMEQKSVISMENFSANETAARGISVGPKCACSMFAPNISGAFERCSAFGPKIEHAQRITQNCHNHGAMLTNASKSN